MLGIGIGNRNILRHTAADIELRYQASRDLQLSLSLSAQFGASEVGPRSSNQYHALAGVSWMLR